MHGLVFIALRDYLTVIHGAVSEQAVTAGEPPHLLSEAYPDEHFNRLLERACPLTGLDRDAILHDFGRFTAERTFPRLYPGLYALSASASEFLLTVEQPIHEIVRIALPAATPPRLTISGLADQRLSIVYDSPRRMCALLRGLVEGTARHYAESAQIEERFCMHRGDNTCTFEIRLARS